MADIVANQIQINPFENFCFGLRSKETQRQYPKILNIFLDFIVNDEYPNQTNDMGQTTLEEKCLRLYAFLKDNSQAVQQKIKSFVNYHKRRIEGGEIASGTLKNYVKVIRFFCDMNNIQSINWKIIYRGLPHVKQHSDDRVPTIEEIAKLVDFDDRRIKVIAFNQPDEPVRIELLNASGDVMREGVKSNENLFIDTRGIERGMYTMRISRIGNTANPSVHLRIVPPLR